MKQLMRIPAVIESLATGKLSGKILEWLVNTRIGKVRNEVSQGIQLKDHILTKYGTLSNENENIRKWIYKEIISGI